MRGVREKGSSGSGLSESRCSFLFRAFVSPNKGEEGRWIERERGEEKGKVRQGDKRVKVLTP